MRWNVLHHSVNPLETFVHCDLIEKIFVCIYCSHKCFISTFCDVHGNDLPGVITCWPLGLFWIGCSAVQGPFSFFPHALLTETKMSVQEQLEECRELGKEVFSNTGFPMKTSGTISIMLLALDIVDIDGCIRYCITGPCCLKSNVFLLQTFGKGVFSVFSKSMLLWHLIWDRQI